MAAQTIIAATTDAVSTQAELAITQSMLPVTIFTEGLDSGETVTLHISPDDGTTWSPLILDGTTMTITAADGARTINTPMLLGITKTSTVASCGVYAAHATARI